MGHLESGAYVFCITLGVGGETSTKVRWDSTVPPATKAERRALREILYGPEGQKQGPPRSGATGEA